MSRLRAFVVALLVVAAISGALAWSAERSSHPSRGRPAATGRALRTAAADEAVAQNNLIIADDEAWRAVITWVNARNEQARRDYLNALADAAARARAIIDTTPEPPHPLDHPDGFLACVRQRESGGDYTIHELSGASKAAGGYQFLPSTWDATARAAGRPDLVGIDPAAASPADQDAMAEALYAMQGAAPWGGHCP